MAGRDILVWPDDQPGIERGCRKALTEARLVEFHSREEPSSPHIGDVRQVPKRAERLVEPGGHA